MLLYRLLCKGGGLEQCSTCEAEHEDEGQLLEEIGRLLGDVRASARSVTTVYTLSNSHADVIDSFLKALHIADDQEQCFANSHVYCTAQHCVAIILELVTTCTTCLIQAGSSGGGGADNRPVHGGEQDAHGHHGAHGARGGRRAAAPAAAAVRQAATRPSLAHPPGHAPAPA